MRPPCCGVNGMTKRRIRARPLSSVSAKTCNFVSAHGLSTADRDGSMFSRVGSFTTNAHTMPADSTHGRNVAPKTQSTRHACVDLLYVRIQRSHITDVGRNRQISSKNSIIEFHSFSMACVSNKIRWFLEQQKWEALVE